MIFDLTGISNSLPKSNCIMGNMLFDVGSSYSIKAVEILFLSQQSLVAILETHLIHTDAAPQWTI